MKFDKGIVLVEVVIGAAIIASAFAGILGVYSMLTRYSYQSLPRMQAAMLAEEGLEAARSMRDTSYSSRLGSLTNNATYYLLWSTASSTYSATTTVSKIDNTFTRTFSVAPAYRDASYNLSTSGTVDNNTKLVSVTVAWKQGTATSTYMLKSYISNIFSN